MKEKISYWDGGMKACVYPGTLDDSVAVENGCLGPCYVLESYCPLEMVYSDLKIPAISGT